jgi:hypothetical protein
VREEVRGPNMELGVAVDDAESVRRATKLALAWKVSQGAEPSARDKYCMRCPGVSLSARNADSLLLQVAACNLALLEVALLRDMRPPHGRSYEWSSEERFGEFRNVFRRHFGGALTGTHGDPRTTMSSLQVLLPEGRMTALLAAHELCVHMYKYLKEARFPKDLCRTICKLIFCSATGAAAAFRFDWRPRDDVARGCTRHWDVLPTDLCTTSPLTAIPRNDESLVSFSLSQWGASSEQCVSLGSVGWASGVHEWRVELQGGSSVAVGVALQGCSPSRLVESGETNCAVLHVGKLLAARRLFCALF